jgi:ribonuclease HI
MYIDGSYSIDGSRAGMLLVSLMGEKLKYMVHMLYHREHSTNNTAEYEGLLAGLRITKELGILFPAERIGDLTAFPILF